MKNSIQKLLSAVVPTMAVLTVIIAKAFAAAPCIGPIYEPELPEELRK